MDPVSRLGRVMGLLRARQTQATRGHAAASGDAARAATVMVAETARGAVARRLRELDMDTPQGQRQAVRVFLDTVLSDEFGDRVAGSARFSDLVDEVQAALDRDAGLHAELLSLLRGMRQAG